MNRSEQIADHVMLSPEQRRAAKHLSPECRPSVAQTPKRKNASHPTKDPSSRPPGGTQGDRNTNNAHPAANEEMSR